MLEAENLVKQFEKNEKKHKKVLFSAVDHVSLHIKEGEIVGVSRRNCGLIRSKWCRKDDAAADAWLSDAADGGCSPI